MKEELGIHGSNCPHCNNGACECECSLCRDTTLFSKEINTNNIQEVFTRAKISKLIPCMDSHCSGDGVTYSYDENGEPEQQQCEYCYRKRFPLIDFILQRMKVEKMRKEIDHDLLKEAIQACEREMVYTEEEEDIIRNY